MQASEHTETNSHCNSFLSFHIDAKTHMGKTDRLTNGNEKIACPLIEN